LVSLERASGQDFDAASVDLLKSLPEKPLKISPQILWVIANIVQLSAIGDNKGVFELKEILANYFNNGTQDPLTKYLPELLEERNLWEALIVAGAAGICEQKEISRSILQAAFDQAFDEKKAFFLSAKIKNGKFISTDKFQTIPWIVLGLVDNVPRFEIQDPMDNISAYSDALSEAWKTSPWWIEPYYSEEVTETAILKFDDSSFLGLFQYRNFLCSSFQILSLITHNHTMHPLKGILHQYMSYEALVFEHILLSWLEHCQRDYRRPCLKVHTWPWDKQYCLTIRHDVDRPMTPTQFENVVSYEESMGLGVSWFWIPTRLDSDQIQRLQEKEHEIGLHSMQLKNKKQEIEAIDNKLNNQNRIQGEQWHGGGGGDYFMGHPSVHSAVDAGLTYTEFISSIYDIPYCSFPAMNENGTLYREAIGGTVQHFSADAFSRYNERDKEIFLEWLTEVAMNNFHCVILNHPDSNLDVLKKLVHHLPKSGRLDWQFRQVFQWLINTHTRRNLEIKRLGSFSKIHSFKITARKQIQNLEIHFPCCFKDVRKVIAHSKDKKIQLEWNAGETMIGPIIRIRLSLESNNPVQLTIQTGAH
jgi:hypothetical protein